MINPAKKGLTLIEVLLAIVILGVSMTIFLDAASQGLAFLSEARAYERSRSYLHQLELAEPLDMDNLEEGEDGGSLSLDDTSVSWSRRIEVEGKEEDELFRITTEVRWGEDFSEKVITLLHKPSAVEGGWVQEPAD